MRVRWSAILLVSIFAAAAFAQQRGQWHTTADLNTLISKLVIDRKHSISVKYENDQVSFIIESPQYLKTQREDIKGMIRYDSSVPQAIKMHNVDHRMAVATKEQAREIIEKLATAKKVDLRIYSHDDDYCDDLVFDNMKLNLPPDTPQVLGRVLNGPG